MSIEQFFSAGQFKYDSEREILKGLLEIKMVDESVALSKKLHFVARLTPAMCDD